MLHYKGSYGVWFLSWDTLIWIHVAQFNPVSRHGRRRVLRAKNNINKILAFIDACIIKGCRYKIRCFNSFIDLTHLL